MGRTRNSTGGAEPHKKNPYCSIRRKKAKRQTKLRWEDGVMDDARKFGGGGETGGMQQGIGTAGRSF
jgi:hypothetical protein